MTVCIGALVAIPPVAFAQTATTTTPTTETPAQSETMPAPSTKNSPERFSSPKTMMRS